MASIRSTTTFLQNAQTGGFTRSHWWACRDTDHVLVMNGDTGGGHSYIEASLCQITNDGLVELGSTYADSQANPSLFHPTTKDRYHLTGTDAPGGTMFVVEEDATYIWFAFSTAALLGENKGATGGGSGRRFSAGWLYPCTGIVAFRFNKSTGAVTGPNGGAFTAWDEVVHVPEAGGVNIIGNRPVTTNGGSRTAPLQAFNPARWGDSVRVSANLYAMTWFGDGSFRKNGGPSKSAGYPSMMMTTWQWNSSTKSPEIVTERTLFFSPDDTSKHPWPNSSPIPMPNGDLFVVWPAVFSGFNPSGTDPAAVRYAIDGSYIDVGVMPQSFDYEPMYSLNDRADLVAVSDDLVVAVTYDEYTPGTEFIEINYSSRAFTSATVTQHAGADFFAVANGFRSPDFNANYYDVNWTILDDTGQSAWIVTTIDNFDDGFYSNGDMWLHAERHTLSGGLQESFVTLLPRPLPGSPPLVDQGRTAQLIDAGWRYLTWGGMGGGGARPGLPFTAMTSDISYAAFGQDDTVWYALAFRIIDVSFLRFKQRDDGLGLRRAGRAGGAGSTSQQFNRQRIASGGNTYS